METQAVLSLAEFEQTLPAVSKPLASYVMAVQTGNLVYTSGILPTENGALKYTGEAGGFLVTAEDANAAARLCCLNALAVLKDHLGSLSRIEQVVKLTGYVNSAATFTQHPQVVNGASDLLLEVLGEKGRHARAAVGVASLPLDATVEVELIVQVTPA